MKKVIYSAIAMIAFVCVSKANTIENAIKFSPLVEITNDQIVVDPALTENVSISFEKDDQKESDFAGFVCWLFNMHCQPI